MIFKVQIRCDNAAFEDTPGDELARMLYKLADRVKNKDALDIVAQDIMVMFDINGNHAGDAWMEGEGE